MGDPKKKPTQDTSLPRVLTGAVTSSSSLAASPSRQTTQPTEGPSQQQRDSAAMPPVSNHLLPPVNKETLKSPASLKCSPSSKPKTENTTTPRSDGAGGAEYVALPRERQTVVFVEGSMSSAGADAGNVYSKGVTLLPVQSQGGWGQMQNVIGNASSSFFSENNMGNIAAAVSGDYNEDMLPSSQQQSTTAIPPRGISSGTVRKFSCITLASFTQWYNDNVINDTGLTSRNSMRQKSSAGGDSNQGRDTMPTQSLSGKKTFNIMFNGRERSSSRKSSARGSKTEGQMASLHHLRETRKRRLKKDAPSLYSLELPKINKETGAVGKDLVFPRSLPVDIAIQNVISQERGELRTKATGVGILRFLTEFQESREIIYLYFWYIVVHIRRVNTEKMLIGRYVNLERIVRGAFPRHKAELPPIEILDCILEKVAQSKMKNSDETCTAVLSPEGGDDGLLSLPTITQLSTRLEDSVNSSFCHSVTASEDSTYTGGTSVHRSHRRRKSRQRGDKNSMSSLNLMDAITEKVLQQDPSIIWRCTEAMDAFTVVQKELYELAQIAECCFRRLAMLFGHAFERLTEGKDEVLSAFMSIVPHVVYYVLVYCFPNDVVAGMFNGAMRLNLYRIFYFWCSGLVITFVRVNGWPKPPLDWKLHPLKSNDCMMTQSPPVSELTVTSLTAVLNSRTNNDGPNTIQDDECALSLSNVTGIPCSPNDLPVKAGDEEDDDSFEDVDVEVANGHHRLMLEFQKYAKHVNHLVHELEQRTEGMHREAAYGSPLLPQDNHDYNFNYNMHVGVDKPSVRGGGGGIPFLDRPGANSTVHEKKNNDYKSFNGFRDSNNNNNSIMRNKLHEMNQVSKGLFLLPQTNVRQVTTSTTGGGEGGGGGNDDAATEEIALPPLPNSHAAVSTMRKKKNPSTGIGSTLSAFPLDSTATDVKQYIIRRTGVPLAEVPLPPLDEDTSTQNTAGKDSMARSIENRPVTFSLRTVKVPLPVASPFFQYYANDRLGAHVSSEPHGGVLQNVKPSSTTTSASVLPSPVSQALTSDVSPESNVKQSEAAAPIYAAETSSLHMPLLPQKKNGNLNNNNNNNGGVLKPVTLPPNTQKVINVMLIPPSDAQLRPLQFKNFTREVTRRQLEMERQMDRLSEREQQLRRQYNAENQQGIRRVHQLLAECQSARLETKVYKGLFNKKIRKKTDMRRKKKTCMLN